MKYIAVPVTPQCMVLAKTGPACKFAAFSMRGDVVD